MECDFRYCKHNYEGKCTNPFGYRKCAYFDTKQTLYMMMCRCKNSISNVCEICTIVDCVARDNNTNKEE